MRRVLKIIKNPLTVKTRTEWLLLGCTLFCIMTAKAWVDQNTLTADRKVKCMSWVLFILEEGLLGVVLRGRSPSCLKLTIFLL